jgi:hypothetical protein
MSIPVLPDVPATARAFDPVTVKRLVAVPPISVLFDPDTEPATDPVPPMTEESLPEMVKVV